MHWKRQGTNRSSQRGTALICHFPICPGTFGRVYLVRKRDDTSQRLACMDRWITLCLPAARLLAMKVLRKSRIGDSRLSHEDKNCPRFGSSRRRRRAEYIITERKVLRSARIPKLLASLTWPNYLEFHQGKSPVRSEAQAAKTWRLLTASSADAFQVCLPVSFTPLPLDRFLRQPPQGGN